MTGKVEKGETFLSLTEVAERRGLHYMTIYRHVRTGRLPATKENGEWKVKASDLDREPSTVVGGTPGNANIGGRLEAFGDRVVAGDEPGAWSILENCLGGGAEPVEIHHQLIVPQLNEIGERWAKGELRIVDEHTATAIIHRLVARLGPMMRSKGRSKGTIVIGAVAGDSHSLVTAIISDLLRHSRYSVIDLGGNTPTQSFIDTVAGSDQCRAVGLSASEPADDPVRSTVEALNAAFPSLPVLIGGRGIRDQAHALDLGSAGYAQSSRNIVTTFQEAISASAGVAAPVGND